MNQFKYLMMGAFWAIASFGLPSSHLVQAQLPGYKIPTNSQGGNDRLIFNPSLGEDSQDPFGGNNPGAGRRGGEDLCVPVDQSEVTLTAVVPTKKVSKQLTLVGGKTASSHPTFWFYVPYAPKPELMMQFELTTKINGTPETVYKSRSPLSASGLIGIPLPKTEKPLEVDRSYKWVLRVQCVPKDSSGDTVVYGWVKRVPMPAGLPAQIQAARQPQDRVKLYASAGLWHETLTSLVGDLNCKDPSKAQTWLKDLLQTVGLGEVAAVKPSLLKRCSG